MSPNAAIDQMAAQYSGCGAESLCRAATQVAVMGAAPRSGSWKSTGIRSWVRFATNVLGMTRGDCLPPTADGLVAWSMAFKSRGTYSNYCGAVKSACLMWGMDASAFRAEIIDRAKMAIAKRALSDPGSPGITFELLKRLVHCTLDELDSRSAALYVVSYWYLLRVPSEGLPLRLGAVGVDCRRRSEKEIVIEHECATIFFRRRKNREQPTKAARPHTCKMGLELCPVCTVESMVDIEGTGEDGHLFGGITAKHFNAELKRRLAKAGVVDANLYTSKGFRRGHAQDICKKYGVSPEAFASGNWTSFGGLFAYAAREELEDLFVTKARRHEKKRAQLADATSSDSSSGN